MLAEASDKLEKDREERIAASLEEIRALVISKLVALLRVVSFCLTRVLEHVRFQIKKTRSG